MSTKLRACRKVSKKLSSSLDEFIKSNIVYDVTMIYFTEEKLTLINLSNSHTKMYHIATS